MGLLIENKSRVATQNGVAATSTVKAALTVVGVGLTAYTGVLGKKVGDMADQGGKGVTEPRPGASEELEKAQKRLKLMQWAVPVVSGTVLVLGAQEGGGSNG